VGLTIATRAATSVTGRIRPVSIFFRI